MWKLTLLGYGNNSNPLGPIKLSIQSTTWVWLGFGVPFMYQSQQANCAKILG
jgi:hypothetical protein